MTTRTLRAAAACALLATTCLVSPAMAQSAPPPRFQSVDDNGVDLTSGTFNFSLIEGSIGAGEGGLTLEHGAGAGKWSGLLYRRTIGGTPSITVEFGLVADTFTISGTTYTSTKADGATLISTYNGYRYTAADGTKIDYLSSTSNDGIYVYPVSGPQCGLADPGTCAIPVSIQKPNGMVFTLNWDIIEKCDYGSPPTLPQDGSCPSASAFFRFAGVGTSANYGFTVKYLTDSPGNYSAPQSNWYKKTGATFTNLASAPAVLPTLSYANPAPGVEEVTDTGGRVWRFTSSGGTYGIRRPGAASDNIVVTYTADGKVASVTRDGVLTRYARSVSGATATMTITDALNQVTMVMSDLAIGRPTSLTDPLGRVTAFAYDASGRPTGVTGPEGDQILTAYDARGNVTQTTAKAKPGSGLPDIVTTAGYDATCGNGVTCNQPNWTRDAAGNQTDYAYDATTGHVTSVTAPVAANGIRPQTRYAYGSVNGVPVLTGTSACQTGASCTGTADEVRTTIGYNANLLPETVSTGAGDGSLTATQTATYTPLGDVETVDGPLPGPADTSRAFYNASREMVGTIGPDPDGAGPLPNRAQRIERNADGDPTSIIGGTASGQSDAAFAGMASLEATRIGYDAGRRKVYESHDSGVVTDIAQWSYDAAGRPDCAAVRMNRDVYWSLPASACQLGVQGAEGPDRITRTLYDAAGRPTARIVALGTADEAREVTASYTDNGQLATLVDGENNKTSYVYDGFDRLSRTIYPAQAQGANASSTTDYEELGYDARGLVTSRRLRDGQLIGLGYDALSRLTSNAVPGEPVVTVSYDNLSRPLQVAKTGGTVSFTYDALGRMLTDTGPNGTVRSRYDLGGRRTVMTDPLGFDVTYDYLVTGETTLIGEFGATSGGGVLAQFGYDDRGRRTSPSRGGGATETRYAYDPASRLSSMAHDLQGASADLSIGFGYNPASQIVSRSANNDAYSHTPPVESTGYASDGLNRMTQAGAAAPTFDARGNMTSDGSNAFGYSAENRMTGITIAGQAPVALAYDAVGRLIGAGGSRLDYDGDEPILERDAGGNFVRRHVWGPGSDELIAWYEGGAGRRFVATDERGSLIAVTNNEGYPIAIDRYDEYGNPAPGNWGAIQYTGQMRLGPVYHYKNRDYHPGLGRFLQTDPIDYNDGMNLYAYVGGDPVNFTDPSGLMSAAECKAEQERAIKNNTAPVVCGSSGGSSGGGGGGGGGGFGGGGGGGGYGGGLKAPLKPENDDIVVTARRRLARALDSFAENHLKPPEGRRAGESRSDCLARVTSPESAGVGAAAVELGRGNTALYPRGVSARASGTSYISTAARGIEKLFGGGGVGSRGSYWFGAKTFGGAVGRGLSRFSVAVGAAVVGFEGGKAIGAAQICR